MFFKMIQNNNVIDVGCTFLRWNEEKKRMYISDPDNGQFVQSIDETKAYKDTWMRPSPDVPCVHTRVIGITQEEFENIKAMLDDGEEIVAEPPIEVLQKPDYKPEEEKTLSIAEMRTLIIEQQKQIDELVKQITTG